MPPTPTGPFQKKPEPEVEEPKPDKIYLWRVEQFKQMGFSETNAELLASAKRADLTEARTLLKNGCPLDVALKLLL